jgi:SAM-dependent methyltransferase
MTKEIVHKLDAEALDLFARKGTEGGAGVPQAGLMNGVKVRRIMQVTRDLVRRPFPRLRILDLGCGEGVYAIEAALRGAEVVALDARTARMDQGRACAERLGLKKVRFLQEDVRRVTREAFGSFDVVYFLGLLYHLDTPDVFKVLENIHGLGARLLVIDTLVSLGADIEVGWRGQTYQGRRCREHEDDDPAEVRRTKLLKSIDNPFSFRFTRESLLRALHDVGYTSVFECRVPLEPGKAADRTTLAAVEGKPVRLSTYPWVNDRSEAEIEQTIQTLEEKGR